MERDLGKPPVRLMNVVSLWTRRADVLWMAIGINGQLLITQSYKTIFDA